MNVWPALAALGALLLAGCAQAPRAPVVHLPTTARAAERPVHRAVPMYGAIYNASSGAQALFEDRRPRERGDTLTILVSENVNASKSSGANSSRSSAASMDFGLIPKIFKGLIGPAQSMDIAGKNTLSAEGGANASNVFNGVITVTVLEVLPNGNLLVSGEKQMLINQGTEFIRFSGVVNSRTISASNSVMSTQVADARMEYSATGYIDEAQHMGWMQRFFLNVAPL